MTDGIELDDTDDDYIAGTVRFTDDECHGMATLPLAAIKPIVTEPQFSALTKFVQMHQLQGMATEGGLQ